MEMDIYKNWQEQLKQKLNSEEVLVLGECKELGIVNFGADSIQLFEQTRVSKRIVNDMLKDKLPKE